MPAAVNPAALIVELALAGRLKVWASPAIIEEYAEVLREHSDFLQRLLQRVELCYPLTELEVIQHKPDNRFLECALAVKAHYLVTINIARGHFDRKEYPGRARGHTERVPDATRCSGAGEGMDRIAHLKNHRNSRRREPQEKARQRSQRRRSRQGWPAGPSEDAAARRPYQKITKATPAQPGGFFVGVHRNAKVGGFPNGQMEPRSSRAADLAVVGGSYG
ncbi:MAG: PIN domain-containing protein [Verrucomicrobiae bacterium]|nr:PIN domain-containing protein [Verrucomicrobiae bacterium]